MICELCTRDVNFLTKHHLIPKSLHKKKLIKKNYSFDILNKTILLCDDCHYQIGNGKY